MFGDFAMLEYHFRSLNCSDLISVPNADIPTVIDGKLNPNRLRQYRALGS